MRFPSSLCPATFLPRPNRFLAMVEAAGREVPCHLPSSGRAGDLLTAGARVYLQAGRGEGLGTAWDLVPVRLGE